MEEMDETKAYAIVYLDEDGEHLRTMVYHHLAESNPDYLEPEYTPIRTYTREQLRATDRPVADAGEAKMLIQRATRDEPLAVPVSVMRELGWVSPEARFFGFETPE